MQWAYSNLGVALLGHLLAHWAGMDYEALLEERILRPLGMASTSITLPEDQSRRLAPGHDRYLEPVRTWEMATLPASGSLRSTAEDMLTLLAAYLGYESTPLASAMSLQLGERIPRDDAWQALGWVIRSDGIVRHAGGKQGYRSGVAFDPRTGVGAVVLANARTDDEPLDLAIHLVTGSPLPPAPPAPVRKRVTIDPAVLDRYAGRYRLGPDRVLEVARKESHLLVHSPGSGVSEFFPTGPTDFFLITGNDEITFQFEGGRVTGLILYGDGRDAGGGRLALRTPD
jgi:CubicO group peptidase (beta-lactamase class C family)